MILRKSSGVVGPLFAFVLLFGVLTGCTALPEVRLKDPSRLKQLYPAMTRKEFLRVMGTEIMAVYGTNGRIRQIVTNPHETEEIPGMPEIEVITYFTNPVPSDGPIRKEELTPFVFQKGKLLGSGWDFLEALKEKENP